MAKKPPAPTKTPKAAAPQAPKVETAPALPPRPAGALALQSRIAAAINRKFGEGHATRLGSGRHSGAQVTEVIPTGIDAVDHYLWGSGGMPIGRITEVYGENQCGKTTLMYRCLAQVQSMGGVGVVIDADHAFDEYRAAASGVDVDALMVSTPTTMEEAFEVMKLALRAHEPAMGPMLVCWDALASSVSAKQLGAEAGKVQPGDIARLTSAQFPIVLTLLGEQRAHLLILNQTRVNIGIMFGSNVTTPGGNAPKFYSTHRVQIMGGKAVKNAQGEHLAKDVLFMAVKTRFVAPFRRVRVRLDYATGYSDEWTTINWAKERGLIDAGAKGASGYAAALEAIKAAGGWGSGVMVAAAPEADPLDAVPTGGEVEADDELPAPPGDEEDEL